jgi:hypothetical protein
MSLWTRIRGGLGIAVMWGIAWQFIVVCFASYRIIVLDRDDHVTGVAFWLRVAIHSWPRGFGLGFVVGMGFALLVAAGERERTVSSLSTVRVIAWGALASGLLSGMAVLTLDMFLPPLLQIGSFMAAFAVIGAASAAGTIALARGGSDRAALPGWRFTLPAE